MAQMDAAIAERRRMGNATRVAKLEQCSPDDFYDVTRRKILDLAQRLKDKGCSDDVDA